jgi:hypothetical protein
VKKESVNLIDALKNECSPDGMVTIKKGRMLRNIIYFDNLLDDAIRAHYSKMTGNTTE